MSCFGAPKKAIFGSFGKFFSLDFDITPQLNMQIVSVMLEFGEKKEHFLMYSASPLHQDYSEILSATPPLMSNCRQGRGTVKQRIRAFYVFLTAKLGENSQKWQFFSVGNEKKTASVKKATKIKLFNFPRESKHSNRKNE